MELRERIPHLNAWLEGKEHPTLKQLEHFANAARVAVGYLFLSSPPDEQLPIADMRTVGGHGVRRPTPDLLDTIRICQRRQDWYRDYAAQTGEEEKPFVQSATLNSEPDAVAHDMRQVIGFGLAERVGARSREEALRLFIERAEAAGVLVMLSGIVGLNTKRPLDANEFRGFALADTMAPVVFVNSTDAEAAQMFTLAHELAHIWLGKSAVTDASMPRVSNDKTEQWCNRVAAEFLVPSESLAEMDLGEPLASLREYASRFKVSKLVILRRLFDMGMIERSDFDVAYVVASQSYKSNKPEEGGGGNFYNTFPRRASRRLIRALCSDTLAGTTPFRDALHLLGINKADTLRGLAKQVGVT